MEFLGDQDKTYTFVISDGYNSVRKKIVYKEVVKSKQKIISGWYCKDDTA